MWFDDLSDCAGRWQSVNVIGAQVLPVGAQLGAHHLAQLQGNRERGNRYDLDKQHQPGHRFEWRTCSDGASDDERNHRGGEDKECSYHFSHPLLSLCAYVRVRLDGTHGTAQAPHGTI